MKISRVIAIFAAAAAFAGIQPAAAQTGDCSTVVFSADVLARFPNIREACLDVIMRDGREVAVLKAELMRVGNRTVNARFKMRDGGFTETRTFEPEPDFRVKVDGRNYRLREMGQGAELSLYIPVTEPVVAFAPADETAPLVYLPPVEEEEELPKTASNAGMIALLGGLFLAIAGGLAIRRRQYGK